MDKDLKFAEAKLQEAHALPESVRYKQDIIRQWEAEIQMTHLTIKNQRRALHQQSTPLLFR